MPSAASCIKRRSKLTRTQTDSLSCLPCTLSNAASPGGSLFPPRKKKLLYDRILEEILEQRVVSSRNRSNPRGVKRKMSNYKLSPRKRQKTRRLKITLRVLKR
jgi:hypothetical protein